MEVTCDFCKKIFEKKPHRILRSKTHFCSTNCSFEFKKSNSTRKEVICEVCGKLHFKNKKDVERNLHNFCSKKCMKTRITLTCKKCSKDFKKAAFHDNHGKCKSCYLKDFFKNNPEKLERKRFINRSRWRIKNGIPQEISVRKKKQNGYLGSDGYKIIYKENHPNAWTCGRIHEHVWVMSEYLGRSITNKETIHHKNGVRSDNRIENLELWHKKHPSGQRVEDKIKYYIEFLNEYGYDVIKRG